MRDTGCSLVPLTIGPVAQRITRLTTDQKIAGSNPAWVKEKNIFAPPGGLEPPTFRLTAERASQLRHGGSAVLFSFQHPPSECTSSFPQLDFLSEN